MYRDTHTLIAKPIKIQFYEIIMSKISSGSIKNDTDIKYMYDKTLSPKIINLK